MWRVQEVEEYGEKHLAGLPHDEVLGDPDWGQVERLTQLDISSIIPDSKEVKQVGRSST